MQLLLCSLTKMLLEKFCKIGNCFEAALNNDFILSKGLKVSLRKRCKSRTVFKHFHLFEITFLFKHKGFCHYLKPKHFRIFLSLTQETVSIDREKKKKDTHLTLFRMRGGGAKMPPYQFFPCNFYKRRNQPSKLSNFQF